MLHIDNYSRSELLKEIKEIDARGIEIIRIPIDTRFLYSKTITSSAKRQRFKNLTTNIRIAASQGLSVILDAHNFNAWKSEDEARHDLTEFWSRASQHWSSLPRNVSFEILNEPNGIINERNFYNVVSPAYKIIKKHDRERKVIIGGPWFSHVKSLRYAARFDDENVTLSFHLYDPMEFTHSGANWMASPKSKVTVARAPRVWR